MTKKMDRQAAWELLCRYTQSEALRRHALAVEGVMRHFAQLLNQPDADTWAVVGLLHDLDYEQYPDQHCIKVQEILAQEGVDPAIIRAVASHGYGICCDIQPVELNEKVLYTIDELTGLVNATAIMRPSKSVMDLEAKSVKKKFKDPRFAAGVDREIIKKGCEMLGFELDYVIEQVILGMRSVAESIGLFGEPASP